MLRERPLCTVCTAFLCIMAVSTWITLRSAGAQGVPEESATGDNVRVQGSICGQVIRKEIKAASQALYLKNTTISIPGSVSFPAEQEILLYDSSFSKINTGETIRASGEIRRPERARNPGNFDAAVYYQRQGIGWLVFADSLTAAAPCPKGTEGLVYQIKEKLFRLRCTWKELLQKAAGEKNGGILSAILLGDKSSLEDSEKTLYVKSGVGHILAVSGLHVSFIGLGIYRLLRKLRVSHLGAGMIGMAVLCFYLVMLGPAVSIIRAIVMLAFRIGADLAGRTYDPATGLAAAGSVVAIWRPASLFDAGFLFSFGAVFGILWLVPVLQNMGQSRIWRALSGSIGIQLVLLPVSRWFYYEIPLYAPVINLAVIPLLSFLMMTAMLGSLCIVLFPPAGKVCFMAAGAILKCYHFLCAESLKIPFARLITGKPQVWQILLFLLLLAWIRWLAAGEKRKTSSVSICILLICAAVLGAVHIPSYGRMEAVMLDVGQGDGMFVRGPSGQCYLIDGGSSDIKNIGEYRLEPYLESQGAGTLDYVFISHGDADHINGIAELLEKKKTGIQVRNLVLPQGWQQEESLRRLAEKAAAAETGIVELLPGGSVRETFFTKELVFNCLGPQRTQGRDTNENSMVLSLTFGGFSMLLTGDVSGSGEEDLVKRLKEMDETEKIPSYTILKTAHHGSKYSTPETLLNLIHPKMAFISAGIENRYGHPHKETLNRLSGAGCNIYQTPDCGAVRVQSDGKKVWITPFITQKKP